MYVVLPTMFRKTRGTMDKLFFFHFKSLICGLWLYQSAHHKRFICHKEKYKKYFFFILF
jgi:hypothetical protein